MYVQQYSQIRKWLGAHDHSTCSDHTNTTYTEWGEQLHCLIHDQLT